MSPATLLLVLLIKACIYLVSRPALLLKVRASNRFLNEILCAIKNSSNLSLGNIYWS